MELATKTGVSLGNSRESSQAALPSKSQSSAAKAIVNASIADLSSFFPAREYGFIRSCEV